MRKMKNKKILVTMNMPPLYHTIPGEQFDIRKSECIQWLIRRPDILNYLWDQIKQSGYIVFDPQNGKWHGIDYSQDEFDGVFGKCSVCNDRTCESGYCSWDE